MLGRGGRGGARAGGVSLKICARSGLERCRLGISTKGGDVSRGKSAVRFVS